jgi:hypothetical protein
LGSEKVSGSGATLEVAAAMPARNDAIERTPLGSTAVTLALRMKRDAFDWVNAGGFRTDRQRACYFFFLSSIPIHQAIPARAAESGPPISHPRPVKR